MQVNLGAVLLTIIVVIIAIAVLWWVLSKLYERATTERAFVRTGFLGAAGHHLGRRPGDPGAP